MRVTRIGWAGTRTDGYGAMLDFLTGVELLGGQVDEHGQGWRHFRAPDGKVYELTSG
jgi:hypothetical protein